jgi:hypothetical protein
MLGPQTQGATMQKRVLISVGLLIGVSAITAQAANVPNVQFTGCTEFVGIAPVDQVKARALVPPRYTLVTDVGGAKLVVRVTDCKAVRVGNLPSKPGRVAQVGLMIFSPDGTGTDPNTAINNYTLSYASNVPGLVAMLRLANVPAALDARLEYEFTPDSGPAELYAAVSPLLDASPTWFLNGKVNPPTFGTTFLANWWFLSGSHEIKMESVFPAIAFDFASTVSFVTSRHNIIGGLLSSNRIDNFPLSFRGAYDSATMATTSTWY